MPDHHVIFLDKTLPKETLIHTALHEIAHMLVEQSKGMHPEVQADAIATCLAALFKVDSIEQLFGKI
jgi:hypothetical protein